MFAWIVSCGSDDEDIVRPPPPPPPPFEHYIVIDEGPSWSADGKTIAYYHWGITEIIDDENYEVDFDSIGLCIVDTAGVDAHLILNTLIADGRFSHLDDSIAIQVGNQIYRSRLVDGYLTPLTQLTSAGSNFDPAWSPDDAFIAYESTASGRYEIWRMTSNGDGKRMIPLTWGPRVIYVDWFPSGDRIVASTYDLETKSNELVVFDTTGVVVGRLASSPEYEDYPRVSPDGSMVAFERVHDHALWVWTVRTDGSDERPLVHGRNPAWSPCGQWLAYVAADWEADKEVTIWKLHVSSGVTKRLTRGP